MATIQFMPVCTKCKKVIFDYIDCNNEVWHMDNVGYVNCQITPYSCPNCGAIFEEVTMPTELPFDNRDLEMEELRMCCRW